MKAKHTRLAGYCAALVLALAGCGGVSATANSSAAAAPSSAAAAVASAAAPKPAASGVGGSAAASAKPAASGSAAAKPVASEVLNPKPAAGGTKVTMCIPSRSNPTLPSFAAVDSGAMAQAGLDVTLPYFAGGAVDVALAAGQCDFVYGAGGVGPLLQGVDVVMVAVTLNKSQFEVWGRPRRRPWPT